MTDTFTDETALDFLKGGDFSRQEPPEDTFDEKTAAEFLRREGMLGAGVDPDTGLPRTVTSKTRERETMFKLQQRGVDIESGGPPGVRAELSLTPPERKNVVLDRAFGIGNHRMTSAGPVVKIRDKATGELREVLLDEAGFSIKDIADMAGGGLEIAGALGASLAALVAAPGMTVGVPSLLLLAVIAGLGGQIAGGSAEVVQLARTGDIDLNILANIAKRRGIQTAIDTGLDFLTAGGARVLGKTAQFGVGPFAERLGQPVQQEIKGAAERLGVDLSPGQRTGSPTLLQAEAVASKVPGAREVQERAAKQTDVQIRARQEELTAGAPSASETGERIADDLTAQRAIQQGKVNDLRDEAAEKINADIQRLSGELATRSLSPSESGELVRRNLVRERNRFRTQQRLKETNSQVLIEELPPEAQKFASPGTTKTVSQALLDEFPKREIVEVVPTGVLDASGKTLTKTVTTTELIPEFLPPQVKRFLLAHGKLPPKMPVDELRKVRQVINTAIDQGEALPGLSTGMLKRLSGALTADIRAATQNAPTKEIRDALVDASEHYRLNNSKFRSRVVSRAFREEGQPGAVDSDEVLPNLILKNKFEDAARVLKVIGPESVAANAARRSTFDEILTASKNSLFGDGTIDPKLLGTQLDKLRPESKLLLFGTAERVAEVDQLVRLLGARHNLVDIDLIRKAPGNEDILSLLRRSAAREEALQSQFDNQITKRIIRGELGATAMNPDQFVRFVLKNSSDEDLKALFKVLPKPLQEAFRSRTIIHLMERAARRQGDSADQILSVLNESAAVGDKLLSIIGKDFGEDTAASIARIRFVLGEDTFKVVKDLGVVEASRTRGSAAAKSAGGLVGGSILSNFLSLSFNNAFRLIKFKAVAQLLRSSAVRKWLTSGVTLPTRGARQQAFELALPQITETISAEFAEDSETAAAINEFFRQEGTKRVIQGK